jgi:hypothetical protein
MEIKRVEPFSIFKMAGVIYAFLGLIAGCIITLFSLAPGPKTSSLPFGGVFAVVILPVVYGIAGAVFGAIAAALYNLVAKFVGGIKITLER